MNDEEFLKEHPSILKEDIVQHKRVFCGLSMDYVNMNTVHETQLDKEKVREAIDKRIIMIKADKNGNGVTLRLFREILKRIKKELGL